MKIRKLPAETRSKLESGILVTDAVQCVLELVHNSLDAEATGIVVRVDLKSFRIKVIDNGKGIPREDLEFVGERFMTSKYQSSDNPDSDFFTYGYKGQAISSLLDVCKSVIIETKSEKNGPTFMKVLQNNKASPITEVSTERRGTGTTVTVEDFMCTMPVRRKRIHELFDNEEIKTQLLHLAIIHYNVCFTFRNENKNLNLLQTSQASNILQSLSNIFGSKLTKCLKPVNYSDDDFEITGYVNINPQIQNNLHLVYVNKRVITKSVIHKFIYNLMREYNGSIPESTVGEGPVLKKLKNSLCNAFVILINCPNSYYELFTNLRKTKVEFKNWKHVLKCVHKAIKRAFKLDDKSLDSTSNDQGKNKNEKSITKIFGTSLLVNAVRGAPVKRILSKKEQKKKKKTENLDLSFLKDDRVEEDKNLEDSKNESDCKDIENCTVDSLESPIPRKRCRNSNFKSIRKTTPQVENHSFSEFFEWLKTKFESDPNVFDLYNNFLKSKKKEAFKENLKYDSPVLDVKKMKGKVNRKVQKVSSEKLFDEDLVTMTRNQHKIFPHGDFRVKKPIEVFKENTSELPNRNLKTDRIDLNFVNDYKQMFKIPAERSIKKRQNQVFYRSLPSPASSEVQFTNVIKFRNFCESFSHESSNIVAEIPENRFSSPTTSTWTSHYQNHPLGNLEVFEYEQNYIQFEENLRRNNLKDDHKSYKYLITSRNELIERERISVKDAEVQVDLTNEISHSEKVDAMVQTSDDDLLYEEDCVIPESPRFEIGNDLITEQISGTNFSKEQTAEINLILSQEVPTPDFWNISVPKTSNTELVFCPSENATTKNSTSINFLSNEKKSTFSEPICCGQRSNFGEQSGRSSSKETQTHAALWPDSLLEMVRINENPNSGSLVECSVSNTKSDSTQLPKTVPLEQLECDFTESGFTLTGRHDFVPKGLSPKCLNVETAKAFPLSPREKCRIKLTIDNSENELLASVKWQDESSGSFTKPIIPDGILSEMREKAERNVVSNENRILSASMSYCAVKVHNLLHSFAFTKELLSSLEILGQLDKKFIVAKIDICSPRKMELISLFDQHAVDERIKLEELINDHVTSGGKFISSSLNPPIECIMNESDVRVVTNLKEKMKNFGLIIRTVNENTISFQSVPTFMLNKHEKDMKNGKDTSLAAILQGLVLNIANEITETRGAGSKIPKMIHNAFCLEACHRAIKFNRVLSKEAMIEMINKLKKCALPFQCAHGRPSVIPIIDLQDFTPKGIGYESFDFEKIKEFSKRNQRSF